ncbi:MAG TPA: hypothetical protein DIT35_03130, partial [Rhodospirillaceae bacterium]|nr:hypothetical protein [Rhodospirillaceae bacterium]
MAPLVLLTSWPFVAFLANNLDQTLRSREVVLPWAAMLAVAVASTLALSLLLHKQPLARIAIVIGVLSAVFFSFGSVAHLLILAGIEFGTTWLGVWLIVFVAAGWVSWVLAQRPS